VPADELARLRVEALRVELEMSVIFTVSGQST
jgi:hypothetical protein